MATRRPENAGYRIARERLPFAEPYAFGALLDFLSARAIPGVEEAGEGCYRRAFMIAGVPGKVAVHAGEGGALHATIETAGSEVVPEVVRRLRCLFDLDADPAVIDVCLSRDPFLAPLVRAKPGLRVPGAWDPFELAVRAILGQQVSVAAARTFAGRIAAMHGDPIPGAPARAFPDAARLANGSLTAIGLTKARSAAIGALARTVLEHPEVLKPAGDLEATVARLVELPGVGEWTAHYVAMRAFREHDAFPAADLGLLRAMAGGGLRPKPADLIARAQPWRPWRAYAAMHLWRAAAAGGLRIEPVPSARALPRGRHRGASRSTKPVRTDRGGRRFGRR